MAAPGSFFRQWLEEQAADEASLYNKARALGGMGEVALTIGSGMAADVVGGVNASLAALAGRPDPGQHVENARQAFTYMPRTETGQRYLQNVGEGVEYVGERLAELPGADMAREGWYDFTTEAPMAAAVGAGIVQTFLPGGRGGKVAKQAENAAETLARTRTEALQLLNKGAPGKGYHTLSDGQLLLGTHDSLEPIKNVDPGKRLFVAQPTGGTEYAGRGNRYVVTADPDAKIKYVTDEVLRAMPKNGPLDGSARHDVLIGDDGTTVVMNPAKVRVMKTGDITAKPVSDRQYSRGSNFQMARMKTDAVEQGWQKDPGLYIGPGGTGNTIGRRYEQVHNFLRSSPEVTAGVAYVNKDGIVEFSDGRHRFANMRDAGQPEVAMMLDEESMANARALGMLAEEPQLAPTDFREVSPDEFRGLIEDARDAMTPQDRLQVSPLPDDFQGRVFVSPDGKAGFGVNDLTGELIALFRHPDAQYKGVMGAALDRGRVEGANHLNAFDTYLAKGYGKRGAVERSRAAWDDQYAPEGWDKATMGTPDYVTMDLVPRNLQNAEIRQLTQAEPDIGRSMIAAAGGKKAAKAEPVTDMAVGDALRARERYRKEPNTTPGPEASDAEWQAFGDAHGVNLTVTPAVEVAPGVQIPGGLDGTFTIADLFELKSLNIDPNKLPRPVHDALMQKIVRTYDIPNPDPVDVFNRLSFALLSPNAPLLPNEFLAQRLRATSLDDIKKLASREGQADLAAALDKESGVGAASRGGMGAKGTADLSSLASLAKAVIEKPEMFRAQPGETMRDVALRVFNQIPGLGPKTASLGVPWLDLKHANVSAVDLHMVRNNYQRLLTDEKVGPAFVERMAKKLKTEPTLEAVQAAIKKDPKKAEKSAIAVIGGSGRSKVFRKGKAGNLNPEVPASLSPDLLWREPKSAKFFNEFYDRVVDFVNESRGADPALALFPEQWRLWDGYRGRFEPHEFAHPDWRKLPKQSFNEMQAAYGANKKAGFARKEGFSGKPHDQSWKRLYYGKADPNLLALMGAGGLVAGGVHYGKQYIEDVKEKQRKRKADLLAREEQ